MQYHGTQKWALYDVNERFYKFKIILIIVHIIEI
jgi:hypothetical protein